MRVSLGVMFLAYGPLKVVVFTLPGTAIFFQPLGLPGFMPYLVTFAEIGGGIALILGIQTHWVAAALIQVPLGDGALAPSRTRIPQAIGGKLAEA